MNREHARALSDGLQALASTTANASASQRVERVVLAAMASRARRRVPVPWFGYAATAVLLLVSMSGAWLAHRVKSSGPVPFQPAGFMPIPSASALPPFEVGSIVRLSLPVSALPEYGISVLPEAVKDVVDAELLVAQDGLPRAIRLVGDINNSRSSP